MCAFIGFMILLWLLANDDTRGCVLPVLIGIAIGPLLWGVIKFILMLILWLIASVFFNH
jgi:hypothetical protein